MPRESNGLFVVGAGSMAEAFLRGVTATSTVTPGDIYVMNRSNEERRTRLCAEYGVEAGQDASRVKTARVVIIACKPADVHAAMEPLLPYLHRHQVLVSFAAGMPMAYLREITDGAVPVIRTMPNLPVAVSAGATAVSIADDVPQAEAEYVLHLLRQLGAVVSLPESLMDAATAFSGSGPGFVCYFLEAMEAAAQKLGFDALTARELLLDTVIGTARVLQEWGLSPEELRRRVTSPGGTTHAGVTSMAEDEMPAVVERGLCAAAARSKEMGSVYAVR